MEFEFNREKTSLIKVLKGKCEKKALRCTVEGSKIKIETFTNANGELEHVIPAVFSGKIWEEENKTFIKGKFTNGFYITGLGCFALILILARLTWSVYKMQVDNIVLCGIATALLVIVWIVAKIKGKNSKDKIEAVMRELEKK